MKKETGITLVSLIVTIIILIILAGISINTLIGDSGIITKAQQAKENITLAQEEEAKQLNQLYSQLNSIGSGSTDTGDSEAIEKLLNFKKVIATAITNEGVTTQETDVAEVMASYIGKILQERTKDATATVEDITEGKTAWVNGNKLTGINKGYDAENKEYLCFPITVSSSFTAEEVMGDYSFLALGGISTVVTDFASNTSFSRNSVSYGDNRTTLRTTQVYVAYCKTKAKEKYLIEQVTISNGMAPSKEGYLLLDLLRTGSVSAYQGNTNNNYYYNKITGICTNATYYAVYVKL